MAHFLSELDSAPGETRRLLELCDDLASELVLRSEGVIHQHLNVESTFWCTFDSAKDGVCTACDLFLLFRRQDWHPDRDLFRAAVVTGDIEEVEDVLMGDALVTALVLNNQLSAGQIVVSEVSKLLVGQGLKGEFGLLNMGAHHLDDSGGAQTLYQVTHPSLKRDFPALPTLLSKTSSLPRMPKPFIGREQELSEILEKFWVAPVVILQGFGGIGKSRLAIRVAEEQGEKHYHGSIYVSLGNATSDAEVVSLVARELGVTEGQQDLAREVVQFLKSREIFLVLDGCDALEIRQSVEKLVGDIARECHHVQMLITSRHRLEIEYSTHYTVRPMGIPEKESLRDAGIVAESDAVRLFCSRAEIDILEIGGNAPFEIGKLVRLLDGIPLAIELVAARFDNIDLPKFLAGAIKRLEIAKKEQGDEKDSLKAAIEWSYRTLGKDAKLLFERLGVFHGFFNEAAVRGICVDEKLPEISIETALRELRNASLIEPSNLERSAYTLLDTVREFIVDSAQHLDDGETISARFREWIVEDLETLFDVLYDGSKPSAYLHVEASYGNIIAAYQEALELEGSTDLPVRIVLGLYMYMYTRGRLSQGLNMALEVYEKKRPEDLGWLWRLVNATGFFASYAGESELALLKYRAAIEIAEQLGDMQRLAGAYFGYGNTLTNMDRFLEARDALTKSLEICEAHGPEDQISVIQQTLAIVTCYAGHPEEAKRIIQSVVLRDESDGWPLKAAVARCNLGEILIHLKEYDDAWEQLAESLVYLLGVEADLFAAEALLHAATASADCRLYNRTAALLGAAERLRRKSQRPMISRDWRRVEALTKEATRALGQKFAVEFAMGAQMTKEELIAFLKRL